MNDMSPGQRSESSSLLVNKASRGFGPHRAGECERTGPDPSWTVLGSRSPFHPCDLWKNNDLIVLRFLFAMLGKAFENLRLLIVYHLSTITTVPAISTTAGYKPGQVK